MLGFHQYARELRDALRFAHLVAAEARLEVISTEHLLLGLVWAAPQAVQRFQQESSVESLTAQLARDVPRLLPPGGGATEIAFSPEVSRVLQHAGDRSNQGEIRPEHLLFAILNEDKGRAAELLRSHGVSIEAVDRFIRSTRTSQE